MVMPFLVTVSTSSTNDLKYSFKSEGFEWPLQIPIAIGFISGNPTIKSQKIREEAEKLTKKFSTPLQCPKLFHKLPRAYTRLNIYSTHREYLPKLATKQLVNS